MKESENTYNETFNGSATTSSLFSNTETLSSTQEINVKSNSQNAYSSKNCHIISLKNNEILNEIHSTFSNVRIRSLLFHLERSMLFGTFGISLKSLGLSIGAINGNYWNSIFAIFTIFSFPICCFAVRHDFANKLYISLNVFFSVLSTLILIRNSILIINHVKYGIFLKQKKELFLVIETLIVFGLIFGMIINIINTFKLRKVIQKLMAKHIDSCLGHRILASINRNRKFKRNSVNERNKSFSYNCVLTIPHIEVK